MPALEHDRTPSLLVRRGAMGLEDPLRPLELRLARGVRVVADRDLVVATATLTLPDDTGIGS
jgi:hypothetical protein